MIFNFQGRQVVILFTVLALLMSSAIAVAYSVHLTRANVGELSILNREQSALEIEWEKLLLEMNLLAGYNRIEANAVRQLDMKIPGAKQLRVVELKGIKTTND